MLLQKKIIAGSGKLKTLIEKALKSGATSAAIITTENIIVDHKFAEMCKEPRCPNYGLSKSCPPNVSGPSGFKEKLKKFSRAVFFKIDIPSAILFSNERREVFQLLHETAAGIEQGAINTGFINAQAYAGGSCKEIFCHDHYDCNVISKKGKCRHPLSARPSMSGFGINVSKLVETAGWKDNLVIDNKNKPTSETTNVYGLVLIY